MFGWRDAVMLGIRGETPHTVACLPIPHKRPDPLKRPTRGAPLWPEGGELGDGGSVGDAIEAGRSGNGGGEIQGGIGGHDGR